MNRTVPGWVVLLLAMAAGGPLAAQTTITTRKASVTLSGELDLTLVYRNQEYFTAQKGNGAGGSAGGVYASVPFVESGLTNADKVAGPGSTDRNRGEFYLDPNLMLNFAIDVGDQARAVIELRTPFVNPDAGGKDNTPGTGFFGGFKDRTLEVKQLYAEVDEIFSQGHKGGGLLLRAGIQDFRKDLRGDGNAFVIDTARSEHPFDAAPAGTPIRYSSGLLDTTEAAGGYAAYNFADLFTIDGWVFNLNETFNALAASRDLLLWGFSANIPLGKESQFGKLFLTVFDLMNNSNASLVTEGVGIVLYPLFAPGEKVNFVEIWGQVYGQQGTYARDASVSGEDIDQRGAYALEFGAKVKAPPYNIFEGKAFVPFAEVSYVDVSGDANSQDNKNSNFVSLEGNNRTLVVENGLYGYDIDANYRGVRAAVGFNLARWKAEALYAYFELQDNSGNRAAGAGSSSAKIGDEIDLSAWYEYSTSLKVGVTAGWLLDSKALGQRADTQITLIQVVMGF